MTDKTEKTKATKAKTKAKTTVKMELVNPKKIAVPKPKKVVVAKPKANAVKVPKKVKDKPLNISEIVDLLQAANVELKEGGSKAALANGRKAVEEAKKYLGERPDLYIPADGERERISSTQLLESLGNVLELIKDERDRLKLAIVTCGRFLICCVTK